MQWDGDSTKKANKTGMIKQKFADRPRNQNQTKDWSQWVAITMAKTASIFGTMTPVNSLENLLYVSMKATLIFVHWWYIQYSHISN